MLVWRSLHILVRARCHLKGTNYIRYGHNAVHRLVEFEEASQHMCGDLDELLFCRLLGVICPKATSAPYLDIGLGRLIARRSPLLGEKVLR